MAEKEEIAILISEEGEVEFLVKGIKGIQCRKLGEELARAIGVIKKLELTSEYYEKEEVKTKIEQKLK